MHYKELYGNVNLIMIKSLSFKTALGWITATEKNKKLFSVKFGKKINVGKSIFLIKAKKQILEYFSGE